MQKQCKNCGKEITEVGMDTFCCIGCQINYYSSKKHNKRKEIFIKTCKHCGKEFETANKKKIYCNIKCTEKH
jgi:hypothetical protein